MIAKSGLTGLLTFTYPGRNIPAQQQLCGMTRKGKMDEACTIYLCCRNKVHCIGAAVEPEFTMCRTIQISEFDPGLNRAEIGAPEGRSPETGSWSLGRYIELGTFQQYLRWLRSTSPLHVRWVSTYLYLSLPRCK